MMKKFLSVLLTVSLLFTVIPSAFAARMDNSFTLYNTAVYEEIREGKVVTSIWKEFSNGNVGNIVMSPGERIVTPAFHAIATDVLSYFGVQVISSDPNVATGQLAYVGASPVGGIANSFLGINITAHNPGTCIITMTYDTFVTRAGVSDNRGNTGYAKAFNVTVTDGALKMSLATNANEIVWNYSPEYLTAKAAYQELSETFAKDAGENLIKNGTTTVATAATGIGVALLAIGLGITVGPGLVLAGALLSATVGAATNVTLDNYFGNTPDIKTTLPITGDVLNAHMGNVEDSIKNAVQVGADVNIIPADIAKNINSAFKAVDDVNRLKGNMSPLQDMLDTGLKAVRDLYELDKATQARNYPLPVYSPKPLTLTIKLTNNSPQPITGISLNITSTNLSLTSESGPFTDSKQHSVPALAPWETREIPIQINIYPKKNYAHSGAQGTIEQLYTGTVAVRCTYTDGELQETRQCADGVQIPVYSCLSEKDAVTIIEAGQAYPQMRATYIMCPVDVEVHNKNGEVVALLTTDGEDTVVGDLICNVNGDAKFIILPQDQVKDYSLRITAVDDGNMTVLGMDTDHTTNLASYDVSIKKGDSFEVNLNESLPATLYSVVSAEEKIVVEPTAVLNEQVILAALDDTDASDYAKADIAQALSRGLVPYQASGAYQEEITLEEFCWFILNFYEKRLDLLPGTLMSDCEEQKAIPEGANEVIATAVWADLLDASYFEKSLDENSSSLGITKEEAATALVQLVNYVNGNFSSGFADLDVVTRESVICILNNIWSWADDNAYLEETVTSMYSDALNEMEEVRIEEFPYIPYYRVDETQKTLLRNFALYAPSEQLYTFDNENPDSALSSIQEYIELEKTIAEQFFAAHIPDAKPIDYKTLNTNKQLTLKLSTLGWREFVDANLNVYYCIPIYYETQDGSIYQNAVYMAIIRIVLSEDTATMRELNLDSLGAVSMGLVFIADQDTIGEAFAQMFINMQNITHITSYPSLTLNDEGDSVKALQEKLIEGGFMKGEATGIYDSATQIAVQAYQKSVGIKATGVADEATQWILNGTFEATEAPFIRWMMPHLARLRGEKEPTISVQIIKDCNIRKEPNVSSQRVGGAVKDDLLTLIDTDTVGWYHIQMPDGTEGYISETVGQILE